MRQKLVAAIFYAAAALATANWLDYGFAEGYGGATLMSVALVGSAVLGFGCLVSLFRLQYGMILGSLGACLSWPYFAFLAISLPWHEFLWFVRIHYHGIDQLAAILLLFAATIYSVVQRKHLWPSPQPHG